MTEAPKLTTSLLPEEIKKSWFQSALGSVMGLAIMLLLTILIYIGLLAALRTLGQDLEGLREWLRGWFWPALLAPLAVITLFQVVPTALRARREQQLRSVEITAGARAAGIFRTAPFNRSEASSFTREDGADDQAVAWVEASADPLLCLPARLAPANPRSCKQHSCRAWRRWVGTPCCCASTAIQLSVCARR